jgi:hypothetical protein
MRFIKDRMGNTDARTTLDLLEMRLWMEKKTLKDLPIANGGSALDTKFNFG